MTTAAIIEQYAAVARPMMLRWMGKRSCIAATRLTCELLSSYGIAAKAVPFTWVVTVSGLNVMHISGIRGEEKARGIRMCREWKTEGAANAWDGHLVAIAEGRWLIDASFDQAGMPGFPIDPMVLVIDLGRIPDGSVIKAAMESDAGVKFTVMYRPLDDWTFTSTEAWTDVGLPLLAGDIRQAMEESRGSICDPVHRKPRSEAHGKV